jgi:hypothetical protein
MEVELEGLDMAEYETDFYPEHARNPELVIEPDGTVVESQPVLQGALAELNGHRPLPEREPPRAPA